MLTQRSDLPLDTDSLSQFLPWLIAFMVYLAVIAMMGMLLLASTAARWDQGVSGTFTVQISSAENPDKDSERLQKALLILGKVPEVKKSETFDDDKMIKNGSSAVYMSLPKFGSQTLSITMWKEVKY